MGATPPSSPRKRPTRSPPPCTLLRPADEGRLVPRHGRRAPAHHAGAGPRRSAADDPLRPARDRQIRLGAALGRADRRAGAAHRPWSGAVRGLLHGRGRAGLGQRRHRRADPDHPAERIANPVGIIDEIGLAREAVATNGGSNLPGLIPALMSLIEPTTARAWTDPNLRIPFDMSRVTGVMTTNAHDHLPHPLLDRCRVVAYRVPTPKESVGALRQVGDRRLWTEGKTAIRCSWQCAIIWRSIRHAACASWPAWWRGPKRSADGSR